MATCKLEVIQALMLENFSEKVLLDICASDFSLPEC